MFNFEPISYLMILVMLLIAISISFFAIRRIKNKPTTGNNADYKTVGILEIIFGFIFMVTTSIFYALIQKNIENTISILRPISAGTSEPVKLMLIALFLVGLSILIIGIYYMGHHTQKRSNK